VVQEGGYECRNESSCSYQKIEARKPVYAVKSEAEYAVKSRSGLLDYLETLTAP